MPIRLRYPELAPEGISTMRATEHYLNATTALPAVLLELIRLRVSLVNGCDFCTGHHTRELRKHNEPVSRVDAVRDWLNSDAFTPRERAALAWADAVTAIQVHHASDEEYAAVTTFFHDKDLVDLTLAIASINAWNRMSIAFGGKWDPSRANHDGSISTENTLRKLSATQAPPDEAQPESPPATTAHSPSQTTPAHETHPTQDAVDDDGGKVAQD